MTKVVDDETVNKHHSLVLILDFEKGYNRSTGVFSGVRFWIKRVLALCGDVGLSCT